MSETVKHGTPLCSRSFIPAVLQLAVLLLLLGLAEAGSWHKVSCSGQSVSCRGQSLSCPDQSSALPQDLHREAPDHHSFQQHLLRHPMVELEQSRLSWSTGGAEEGSWSWRRRVCVLSVSCFSLV